MGKAGQGKGRGEKRVIALVLGGLVVLLVISFLTNDFAFGELFHERVLGFLLRALLWGLGIATSAAWFFDWLYARPAQERTIGVLKKDISRELKRTTSEITRFVSTINPLYYPSQQYVGTPGPDRAFNEALTQDLLRSHRYYFQGTGGMWTAMRLLHNSSRLDEITVVLPNLHPDDIHYHDLIQYEVNIPRNRRNGLSTDAVRDQIAERIGSALVGLFACRQTMDIRLIFTNVNLEYRLEILDDVAYVCDFDRQNPDRAPYPQTVRFDQGSFGFKFIKYIADNPVMSSREGKDDTTSREFLLTAATEPTEFESLLEELQLLRPKNFAELNDNFERFVTANRQYINREYKGESVE